MPKKKKKKMDPKLEKAIKQLNRALQITVRNAVTDLTKLLRFFPRLLKIIEKNINLAADCLEEINEHKSKDLQKHAKEMIAVARKAYANQIKSQQKDVEAHNTPQEEAAEEQEQRAGLQLIIKEEHEDDSIHDTAEQDSESEEEAEDVTETEYASAEEQI